MIWGKRACLLVGLSCVVATAAQLLVPLFSGPLMVGASTTTIAEVVTSQSPANGLSAEIVEAKSGQSRSTSDHEARTTPPISVYVAPVNVTFPSTWQYRTAEFLGCADLKFSPNYINFLRRKRNHGEVYSAYFLGDVLFRNVEKYSGSLEGESFFNIPSGGNGVSIAARTFRKPGSIDDPTEIPRGDFNWFGFVVVTPQRFADVELGVRPAGSKSVLWLKDVPQLISADEGSDESAPRYRFVSFRSELPWSQIDIMRHPGSKGDYSTASVGNICFGVVDDWFPYIDNGAIPSHATWREVYTTELDRRPITPKYDSESDDDPLLDFGPQE